jgi:hypothetical protein
MSLESKRVTSDEVRIPPPSRGVAIRVTRYKQDHSVILHPDDFSELQALDKLVSDVGRLEPLRLSEAGRRAHLEEDRSTEPIEDPKVLRRLFS